MAATGRNARAERLNERLRGAQRVNIADDSFQLDLGAFDAPAASTSPDAEAEPEPRSSSKRRKLDNGASAPAPQSSPSRPRNPYSLSNTSKETVGQSVPAQRSARVSRPANAPAPTEPDPDDLESLPPPPSSVHRSPALVRNRVIEEIEESPADKPGSGRRRNIPPEAALASTSRLQSALRSDTSVSANSSPTTYKSRRSDAAASARSARSVRQTPSRSPQLDIDELSPDGPPELPSIAEETPTRATAPQEEPTPVSEPVVEPAGEAAVEVGDAEAAKALRRKRPRRSPRVSSPELGSNDRNEEENEPSPEPEQPRRKRGRPSPAKQKQGGPKTKTKPTKPAPKAKAASQSKAKSNPKPSPKRKRRTSDDSDPNASLTLTVHRFVNHKKRDADDTDPLQLEIPFANRSGESVVDVFAEVCDEVIEHTIGQLQEVLDSSTDASKKKEFRVKVRAVEAYREVLSSRLLEHTIRLNHWHSLRKRVRHVQKEKLALREEILQLRAEREQVALRMDAVRIKHEADTKESSFLLDTSSTMRDIDLAVAQGREAPELPAKANKEAELANLELAVAQIADQASSAGPTGGLLSQIKDFNGLLERTALALESR